MTTKSGSFWVLRSSFADFRSEHASQLGRGWAVSVVLAAAFLGLQPNWQSDVVAGLILALSAAVTGLAFALTANGMAAVTQATGDSLIGEALQHLVDSAQRWRMAGHLQPAWQ